MMERQELPVHRNSTCFIAVSPGSLRLPLLRGKGMAKSVADDAPSVTLIRAEQQRLEAYGEVDVQRR